MKRIFVALAAVFIIVPAYAQFENQQAPTAASMQPMFVNFKDIKWEKIKPELGDKSDEIAILGGYSWKLRQERIGL